jgi:hypothetical protein
LPVSVSSPSGSTRPETTQTTGGTNASTVTQAEKTRSVATRATSRAHSPTSTEKPITENPTRQPVEATSRAQGPEPTKGAEPTPTRFSDEQINNAVQIAIDINEDEPISIAEDSFEEYMSQTLGTPVIVISITKESSRRRRLLASRLVVLFFVTDTSGNVMEASQVLDLIDKHSEEIKQQYGDFTASSSALKTRKKSDDSGLEGGAVAGIIIALLTVALIAVAASFYYISRRRKGGYDVAE